MRLFFLIILTVYSYQTLAQGSLHVKGKIKADSLANSGYLIIIADSTGTLDTLPPGQPGQVLVSGGVGGKPYWVNNTISSTSQMFQTDAIRTTISSAYPAFTQIAGLSQTITSMLERCAWSS